MARQAIALVAGLIFGLGLSLSHMVDPDKVLAFLDLVGPWDPSLALVMGGALVVTAIGFRPVLGRSAPLLASRYELPSRRDVDGGLLVGATLFGLGWGLSGYCPGSAVAALAVNLHEAVIFLVAVIAGGLAADVAGRFRAAGSTDG